MKSGLAISLSLTVVLGACAQRPEPVPASRDLLFLRSSGGISVVEAGAASPTFRGTAAVPSRDWSTVARSVSYNGSYKGTTGVIALDPSSGAERWEHTVDGNLRVKLVSDDGEFVALGPAAETHYRDGRAQTKLVVAQGNAEESQAFTLDGNYEPEAFSTDGGACSSSGISRPAPPRATRSADSTSVAVQSRRSTRPTPTFSARWVGRHGSKPEAPTGAGSTRFTPWARATVHATRSSTA